jgi:phosphoribosylanthranilate isomerase
MMVKICGITRRDDALAAIEAGASAIGFVFYPPSPRYVTPQRAAEIAEGLPVLKVGVVVGNPPAETPQIDVLQIYGAGGSGRVWRAYRVDSTFDAADLAEDAEAILLDGIANGVSFNWQLARHLQQRIILAGGLDASNVGEAIRQARPWGVDASSRLELSPGIKDHQKVRQFVKAALAERS